MGNEAVDFEEMTKRGRERHLQGRPPGGQKEFVQLFADLLERSYVSKLELYAGEKIRYAGESVEGERATVRTKIVTKQGTEVPVDYRMHRRGDRWLVYDVVLQGISLVANYQSQFNAIIQTSTYQQLVARIKTQVVSVADGTKEKRAALKP